MQSKAKGKNIPRQTTSQYYLKMVKKKAEQDTPSKEFYFNVKQHLFSSLKWGTKSQYDDSRRVIDNFFQIKFPSTKQSEIGENHEMAVEATKDFDAQK